MMKLRVGTFNLFQFVAPPYSWYFKKDKFTATQFEEKKEWVKQQITQMNCDIIGFQEVFSIDVLQTLVQQLGFEYFVTVDTPKVERETIYTSTVVALASKYPIKEVYNVPTHTKSVRANNYKPKTVFARKPIKASVQLPNEKELLVYVYHLKSNRLNEFEYTFKPQDTLAFKKEQTTKALSNKYSHALRQRLCEASSLFFDIQKQNTACIAMGDLNDKQHSITLEALCNEAYYKPHKKGKVLTDTYELFTPIIHNPHPEAKAPVRTPTSYYQGHGNIIDYIFISSHFYHTFKSVRISNYEIYNKHLQLHKDGSLLQSDHAQVVCELTLDT